MMQEKAMVSDALNSLNSGLKTYSDMISQTENQQLRSTLQQMRNETEQSQYELYQIAKSKNYYQPAGQASQNEINTLKSVFSGSTGWAGSSGMSGSGNSK
jgi:spore coat protein CotF